MLSRTSPVSVLVAITLAPATEAPVESEIVPKIPPRKLCPNATPANRNITGNIFRRFIASSPSARVVAGEQTFALRRRKKISVRSRNYKRVLAKDQWSTSRKEGKEAMERIGRKNPIRANTKSRKPRRREQSALSAPAQQCG